MAFEWKAGLLFQQSSTVRFLNKTQISQVFESSIKRFSGYEIEQKDSPLFIC